MTLNSLFDVPLNYKSFFTGIFRILFWKRYCVCSCKVALFAAGLVYGHKLVDMGVLSILTTFFTDNSSQYRVAKAAAFGNLWEFLSATFGMLSTLLPVQSYFSHRKIIICSSVCYITGLVLLLVVSLETFSGSSIYIDIFNAMGVILLALGKGVNFHLRPFLADQFRAHDPVVNEDSVVVQTNVWWGIAWFLTVVTSYFFLSGPWAPTLIITSFAMGIALILFLCGIPFYDKSDQLANIECHPLTSLIRYVKASILNSHKVCSSSSDNVCQNDENDQSESSSPVKKAPGCLDKPAIGSSPERQEQEKAGRLCSMTQVKERKISLIMVPWWIAFAGFGLLLSTGNTFFSEQGHDMAGSLLPVIILQNICENVPYLCDLLLRKWVPKPKWKLARFCVGMVISPICIAIARRTEVFRLSVVKKEGLLDEPDTIIKMSTFSLAPQFCLLGLLKGLVKGGLDEFMIDQLPDTWSWKDYVPEMNAFVIDGIGSLLSIVCIYGNGSLFGATLNRSHLDTYYKRLTIFGVANLCYFCLISVIFFIYTCRTSAAKVVEESQSTIEMGMMGVWCGAVRIEVRTSTV